MERRSFARSLTGGLTIAVTLALTGAASAHLGDRIFPIWELPTSDLPDLHDGTLEDWEDVLPNSSLDHNDFVWTANLVATLDPADLAFRVFLAWHNASQRIYMAIELVDDVYLAPGQGSAGNGYTTFMVDGDHSGGLYAFFEADGYSEEESKRLFGAQAQSYRVSPEAIDDRLLHVSSWATWANDPPWADAGGFQHGESPNYSVVELSVTAWDDLDPAGPELSKRSVLEPGRIVGFGIDVTDFDVQNSPNGFFHLVQSTSYAQVADGSFGHSFFAENFADGELVPCHVGDCSGREKTAITQDSWGRIKASFR